MDCFVNPAPKSQNDATITSHSTTLDFNPLPPSQSADSSNSTSEPFENNERHTSLISGGQDSDVSNSSERATQSRKHSSTPTLIPPRTTRWMDQDFLGEHSVSIRGQINLKQKIESSASVIVPHRTVPSISSPRPFGGVLTAINTLSSFPIEATIRNAELLHFCEPYYRIGFALKLILLQSITL